MRRTSKKNLDLNKLNTGCSPCKNQAKKMQKKILNRNIAEIGTPEVNKIVSSLFKKA